MQLYAGLDVSMDETSIRIVDRDGKKWSALRAWGIGVAKRRGHKRAIVAVAWKLAAVLHRMWLEGTEFRWTRVDGSHGGNTPAIVVAA